MSAAHRRPAPRRFRRSLTAAGVTLATAASFAVFADGASAATTWFVAPAPTGSTASGCGTSTLPCTTVSIVIAKSTFVAGDTISVAAGTYTDHPTFGAKGATVNGAGVG